VVAAWVTVGGLWQPVTSAWLTSDAVWNPVSGSWQTQDSQWEAAGLGAGFGANVKFFTAYPDEQWNKAVVAWNVVGADRVEVYADGVVVYSGTLGAHQLSLQLSPASTTTFTLVTVVGATSTEFGPKPQVSVGVPPAPANLRVTATSPFSITFAWDPVPGKTRYDLRLTNGATLYSGSDTSYTMTVEDADTTVQVQVRTVVGSSVSTWSSSKTGKSASPTWRQGTFYVDPVNAYTYMRGKNAWRPAGDGLFHGNWGDGRGAQHAGLFFGDRFRDTFKADLDKGAEIAKVEIALRRRATGPARRVQARVHLHTREAKPNGDITGFYDASVDVAPTLPKEMDSVVWCELPASWGRKLIRQEGGVKGLAVGMNDTDRYFAMSELTTANRVGRVRITLR
jgi:hypothetical protein